MKHSHDAEININHEFSKEDVEDVIDKVVEGCIIVIAVSTAANILKKVIK